jgi:predicted amidophosphoribosyltransferase
MRCKQCGKPKDDNGWTICGSCQRKNIEYAKQCERLAYEIRQEFARCPPARMQPPELRRPSERRGRKERYARALPYQHEDEPDDA